MCLLLEVMIREEITNGTESVPTPTPVPGTLHRLVDDNMKTCQAADKFSSPVETPRTLPTHPH